MYVLWVASRFSKSVENPQGIEVEISLKHEQRVTDVADSQGLGGSRGPKSRLAPIVPCATLFCPGPCPGLLDDTYS